VFGVQQRALRVHAEGPPWNALRHLGLLRNQQSATSEEMTGRRERARSEPRAGFRASSARKGSLLGLFRVGGDRSSDPAPPARRGCGCRSVFRIDESVACRAMPASGAVKPPSVSRKSPSSAAFLSRRTISQTPSACWRAVVGRRVVMGKRAILATYEYSFVHYRNNAIVKTDRFQDLLGC
jgi:hypothetical protein